MNGTRTIRVATDVGGTFTDLVYFETDADTGRQTVRTAKVDTTPPDFERGVLNVLAKADVNAADIAFFAHGTTVVINALTERKGVVTGLIATDGFRDTLEIARGNRPDFFNLLYEKPTPFVPRHLRRELPGRMTHRGEERVPLDLAALPAILDDFGREGVQAIAVCLLHAYANPSHENAVAAEIKRLWPEIPVVASHQITREWREYERTSTTVLSAYVAPIAGRYLERLEGGLKAAEVAGQLYVMQSNCGVDSLRATRAIPITMVESGPASGVWGAAELGRIIGEPNVLALDIGGTTAKCSLIENGQVKIMTDYWIERSRRSSGYPIMVPVVDPSRSAMAAARSPGSMNSDACTSDRNRPGRGRAPPATAAAVRMRRPRTPISRSAASIHPISVAAPSTPTWTPSATPSIASPASSPSSGSRRRAASSASPTTT